MFRSFIHMISPECQNGVTLVETTRLKQAENGWKVSEPDLGRVSHVSYRGLIIM